MRRYLPYAHGAPGGCGLFAHEPRRSGAVFFGLHCLGARDLADKDLGPAVNQIDRGASPCHESEKLLPRLASYEGFSRSLG